MSFSDSGADGALLALCGIEVALGGREVLRGVDLTVAAGEVVGLVGPNGAGKTTLLRVASRVLAPQSGRASWDGRPLSDYSRRDLSRAIAVVPQDTAIPFPFRAGELVVMGRVPHQSLVGFDRAEDVAHAHAALARVGIDHLADRSVFELSGGERQLVAFARALTQDARLLLLDEPTAFLDLRHRVDVLSVVRALASQGRAALVVSHDLNLAARSCDRLAVLHDGRIVASGAPEEVLTRELLADVYETDVDILTAPDGSPVAVPRM
jgi:iron complex transport system ATP-binding protein